MAKSSKRSPSQPNHSSLSQVGSRCPVQCHASMLPKHLEPNIHHSTMIDSPPSLSSIFTSQPVSMSVDEHTSHLKTYYHNTFPLALTCMDVNDQKLFPIFLFFSFRKRPSKKKSMAVHLISDRSAGETSTSKQ